MVSTQGFNALLKIVEEPPPHVRFVFATTEPEKVIGTIRSRTHHYPFRLVPPGAPAGLPRRALRARGRPGRAGRAAAGRPGRVRGPSATRSRCSTSSSPAPVPAGSSTRPPCPCSATRTPPCSTTSSTRSPPGTAPRSSASSTASSSPVTIRAASSRTCSSACATCSSSRPSRTAAMPCSVAAPADQLERMRGQAARFGRAELSRAADVVNAALTEMTGATSPRLQLELLCARLLLPAADDARARHPRACRPDRAAARDDLADWGAGGVGGPVPSRRPGRRQFGLELAGPVPLLEGGGGTGILGRAPATDRPRVTCTRPRTGLRRARGGGIRERAGCPVGCHAANCRGACCRRTRCRRTRCHRTGRRRTRCPCRRHTRGGRGRSWRRRHRGGPADVAGRDEPARRTEAHDVVPRVALRAGPRLRRQAAAAAVRLAGPRRELRQGRAPGVPAAGADRRHGDRLQVRGDRRRGAQPRPVRAARARRPPPPLPPLPPLPPSGTPRGPPARGASRTSHPDRCRGRAGRRGSFPGRARRPWACGLGAVRRFGAAPGRTAHRRHPAPAGAAAGRHPARGPRRLAPPSGPGGSARARRPPLLRTQPSPFPGRPSRPSSFRRGRRSALPTMSPATTIPTSRARTSSGRRSSSRCSADA